MQAQRSVAVIAEVLVTPTRAICIFDTQCRYFIDYIDIKSHVKQVARLPQVWMVRGPGHACISEDTRN